MRTTVEYLDALRARHNLPSDYALSKLLNLTRSAVSSYRTGRTYFDDETAMRVAELLDLDPAHVLSIIAAERTKSEKVKKAWQRAAAATAALALAAVQVALTGSDGGALNLLAYLAALPFNSSIHYAN